ncbi:hypothetical protein DSCA_43660 [Desulfosarcina alkanivorans]|jgi:hypothetical protein|uniref:Bacterial OB-fold domain-containing protein n=1 Tax=Desulfosarcina alkanivorans TaxID=571177 RepID=A0A5K7YMJ9_9BACT|nr:DUF5818 domain-containing protein [Desulfosarcina alkanivorans]BBO70436.1 hypothetical protein DSCA_43660 [Desulfosarcina alkanivorans]
MNAFKKNIIVTMVTAFLVVVAGSGMAMAEDSITGTITEKGEVLVLDAADGSYVLEGSDVTADMVGKKVTVTGTVAEKEDAKVINVLSMKELQDQ